MSEDHIVAIAQEVATRVLGVIGNQSSVPKVWLNTSEAAAYMGCARDHLGKLRERGTGPTYRKFGKSVIYNTAELDEFMRAMPTHVCRRLYSKRGA
jgi:excisionase family DNA binding protein